MVLDENFGSVESKSMGNFLPVGQYGCKVAGVKWGRSKIKGTLYMQLDWECIEGEFKGGHTFEQKYLTSGTLPYFKGWSESVMNVELNSSSINEKAYVNRVALVKINEVMSEGREKPSMEVNSFKISDERWFNSYNKHVDGAVGATNENASNVSADSDGHSSNDYNSSSSSDDDLPF